MTTDNRANEPSHNRITIRAFRDGEVSIIHEDQVLGLACTLDELKRAVATYEARGALEAADRPAGTFTEAQIEAAATGIALYILGKHRDDLIAYWDIRPDLKRHDIDQFKPQARAALVAAQDAAPQAEQATYLNVAHSSVLAGSINARRAAREVSAMQLIDAIYDPDEDDANDSVRYGYVLEQFERLRIIYADLDDPDAGPAPVLPSSTAPQAESVDCARDRMGICKRCGMGWDARKVLDGDFACPALPTSGVDEDKLAEVIASVTDLWDDPLDEVHDIPQIARALCEAYMEGRLT